MRNRLGLGGWRSAEASEEPLGRQSPLKRRVRSLRRHLLAALSPSHSQRATPAANQNQEARTSGELVVASLVKRRVSDQDNATIESLLGAAATDNNDPPPQNLVRMLAANGDTGMPPLLVGAPASPTAAGTNYRLRTRPQALVRTPSQQVSTAEAGRTKTDVCGDQMCRLIGKLEQLASEQRLKFGASVHHSTSWSETLTGSARSIQLEESWASFVELPEGPASSVLALQQDAIWELVNTECAYLECLRVVSEVFVATLSRLQQWSLLQHVDVARMVSNLDQVHSGNWALWCSYLEPMVAEARRRRRPLDPCLLRDGFVRLRLFFGPYYRYCLEHCACLDYVRNLCSRDDHFRAYLAWCESRPECGRQRLAELLVKPMQRLTRYALLLRAIAKRTNDAHQSLALDTMLAYTRQFVRTVDLEMLRHAELERLLAVCARLEASSGSAPASCGAEPRAPIELAGAEHFSDEVQRLVRAHCNIDLGATLFNCPQACHRQLLFDSSQSRLQAISSKSGVQLPFKFRDTHTTAKLDVVLLLFTDQLLVCRQTAGSLNSATIAHGDTDSPRTPPTSATPLVGGSTSSLEQHSFECRPLRHHHNYHAGGQMMPSSRTASSSLERPPNEWSLASWDIPSQADSYSSPSARLRRLKPEQQSQSNSNLGASKLRVIRAPYPVDRLVLYELSDGQSVLCCQLNETNDAVSNAFVLYCPPAAALLSAVCALSGQHLTDPDCTSGSMSACGPRTPARRFIDVIRQAQIRFRFAAAFHKLTLVPAATSPRNTGNQPIGQTSSSDGQRKLSVSSSWLKWARRKHTTQATARSQWLQTPDQMDRVSVAPTSERVVASDCDLTTGTSVGQLHLHQQHQHQQHQQKSADHLCEHRRTNTLAASNHFAQRRSASSENQPVSCSQRQAQSSGVDMKELKRALIEQHQSMLLSHKQHELLETHQFQYPMPSGDLIDERTLLNIKPQPISVDPDQSQKSVDSVTSRRRRRPHLDRSEHVNCDNGALTPPSSIHRQTRDSSTLASSSSLSPLLSPNNQVRLSRETSSQSPQDSSSHSSQDTSNMSCDARTQPVIGVVTMTKNQTNSAPSTGSDSTQSVAHIGGSSRPHLGFLKRQQVLVFNGFESDNAAGQDNELSLAEPPIAVTLTVPNSEHQSGVQADNNIAGCNSSDNSHPNQLGVPEVSPGSISGRLRVCGSIGRKSLSPIASCAESQQLPFGTDCQLNSDSNSDQSFGSHFNGCNLNSDSVSMPQLNMLQSMDLRQNLKTEFSSMSAERCGSTGSMDSRTEQYNVRHTLTVSLLQRCYNGKPNASLGLNTKRLIARRHQRRQPDFTISAPQIGRPETDLRRHAHRRPATSRSAQTSPWAVRRLRPVVAAVGERVLGFIQRVAAAPSNARPTYNNH